MSKTAKLTTASFVLLGALLAGKFWVQPMSLSEILLCIPRQASSALPAIASERGFFRSEGIKVTLILEDLGRRCVQRLNAGEIDLAVAYVPPVVNSIREGQELSIITEIHSTSRNAKIVYKRDRIRTPRDLAGKKVATTKGTNGEALLRMYLLAHDIPESMVTFDYQKIKDIEGTILRDDIDAIVIWEPELSRVMATGKYDALESSFYTEFSMLVKRRAEDPRIDQAIPAVVRALARAQSFVEQDSESARRTSARALRLDPNELSAEVWSRFRYHLGLSAVLESMMDVVQTRFDSAPGVPLIEPAKFFEPRFLDVAIPELVTYR